MMHGKPVKGQRLTRQIASYFAVILIPLMLIAVLSYRDFGDKSQQDMSARIHLSLAGSIKSVDASIDIAQNACMSLFTDQRVKQYLKPIAKSSSEDRLEQIMLHQQIVSLTNLTGGIAESMFIYLDDQHVFSDGLYSFDDYFNKICKYDDYDADFWRELRLNRKFLTILPATEMTRYPQTVRRVVPLAYRSMIGIYDAVSVMTLSVSNISATIRSGLITSDTRMLILDGDGGVIFSELTAEEEDAVAGDMQEAHTVKTSRGRYMAFQAQSKTTGWQYILLVPMAQITALSWNFMRAIIAMLLTFAVASGLCLYFTRRIARPIRRIYTAIDGGEAGEVPVLEEISQRVSFILSDYHEAHEERISLRRNYIEISLFQLLSGRDLSNVEGLARLLSREYNFHLPVYQCAFLRIGYDWSEGKLQDTERLNMQLNLQAGMAEYLAQEMPSCVLEYRDNEYVLIVNYTQGEGERAYAMFEGLLQRLQENASIASAHISVTHGVEQLTQLSGAFQQAVQAFAAIPESSPWYIGYVDSAPAAMAIHYTLKDEMRLMSALRSGNRERVFALIGVLLDDNGKLNEQQYNWLIRDLYITAMRFLAEQNRVIPDRHIYQGLREEAGLPGGLDEKRALLLQLYGQLLKGGGKLAEESDLIASVIAYVQSNYAKDLYLERIAEEMGLSVKYLSRVFKAKTGQNLSDYINYVRVEHVKALLTGSDMSINDISASVGIHSRTTFLRIFRKLEGVTPSEYRELASGMAEQDAEDDESGL